MKLTVLVDNNTLIDRYFVGEPAVSYLVEDGDTRLLFDVGYSEAFLANARRMGIDLRRLDWVVLSHGHIDHTGGLDALCRLYAEAALERQPASPPTLVAHPCALLSRAYDDLTEAGTFLSEDKLRRQFTMRLSRDPIALTDRMFFLGEIPRPFEFERAAPKGRVWGASGEEPDHILDDTAIACRTAQGLVVLSGCAHAGICNTIEHARAVTGESRVAGVIGGFHLQKAPVDRLARTGEYLASLGLATVHACHCSDLEAKIALAGHVGIGEVGVGMVMEF